jgi:hypothetical protein
MPVLCLGIAAWLTDPWSSPQMGAIGCPYLEAMHGNEGRRRFDDGVCRWSHVDCGDGWRRSTKT